MNEIDLFELGQRIIDYRSCWNLTQAEFGELIGMKKLSVWRFENGKVRTKPRIVTINRILKVLES